jgi:NADPH:quinone reductase-like Zn-dependent oxidoreductase
MTTDTVGRRLRRHGILTLTGRTAALRQLVLQAPAPMVARMLGYTLDHAAAGQIVLVNGAGDAVGGYAVQLAKHARSGRHRDRKRAQRRPRPGLPRRPDHRLHRYTATPVTEAVGKPFDVVLNLVPTSPDETADLVDLVSDGGVLVSTTTPAPENPARRVRTARLRPQRRRPVGQPRHPRRRRRTADSTSPTAARLPTSPQSTTKPPQVALPAKPS